MSIHLYILLGLTDMSITFLCVLDPRCEISGRLAQKHHSITRLCGELQAVCFATGMSMLTHVMRCCQSLWTDS